MGKLSDQPLSELDLQEGKRPKMTPLPGVTDTHRRQGKVLAAIHRGHLNDLYRIKQVLTAIEAGDDNPEALVSVVLSLDMAENLRAFGSICGQECRMLSFHHGAEEYSMFPKLEAKGIDALTAVIGKLRQEHEIVHELITRMERAAMTLLYEPTEANFDAAAEVFRKLDAVIRSHFGYEETELEEALGLYRDVL